MAQEIQDDGKCLSIDTRKLTQAMRWSHWTDVLRRKSESGQTVRAFCQENGIAEDRYYYWQRRLRTAVGEELCAQQSVLPSVPVFAELPVANSCTQPVAAVRMEAGGVTVEIGAGADAGLAEAILRLLLGRC